ncbi:unnamed protein product [Penicillium glandicola]
MKRDLHLSSVLTDPELARLPRQNMFALWFSDINVLQNMAEAQSDAEKEIRAANLRRVPPSYDLAGIWACEGQTNLTSEEEPPEASSSSGLPQAGLRECSRSGSPNFSNKPSSTRVCDA